MMRCEVSCWSHHYTVKDFVPGVIYVTQAFVSDDKLSATIGIELMSSVVGVMGAN